ncbi:peptidase C1A [Streptomyces sp. NA02950]|uniref:C1 family peptidase n=1 Tax=Streptomyces sp. NA02950 TaxID=2742137 RepID=UPI001590D829|nr:C1 family peptidase [Streptomyces sp. NA02950]QKV95169.1 peptidase C1A [Streptomyces sp. NA02950]
MVTYGEIRTALHRGEARWNVNEGAGDEAQVPVYALGVPSDEHLVPAAEAPPVDLAALLRQNPTTNQMLAARRAALGLPSGPLAVDQNLIARAAPQNGVDEAGFSAQVDWRNRWGTNWVTQVRDQNPCGSCVAFGTTAVVESRVRIEHAVWTVRSEGDTHDGQGLRCADGSWPNTYFDWIKGHGIADPACWPYHTDNAPYRPTADRSGRTVKMDGYTQLGSTDDQKRWLDTVGPISCCIEVPDDFFAYRTGVYHKTVSHIAGLHCVAIVGYSDPDRCWIAKNSWGRAWGDGGYVRIGYGEIRIDEFAKYGVLSTNPDPWTKRRLHNGNLYESGNGATHRNFEMLATAEGRRIRHWWRDNTATGFPWAQASEFGLDAACCPTLTSTTFNRNFESVHLTDAGRLHHWWLDQNSGKWNDGGIFGPANAAGVPGFIQSNYGAPGNFEVVVRLGTGVLQHWWRDGGGWHAGPTFGSHVAFSGASLVQSTYGTQGNFELVCTLGTGQMQHWWRDNDHGMVWRPGPLFGSGIAGPPVMIQGQYGMATENGTGNFELCVAAGGRVQHWWRNNSADMSWHCSAVFGHDIAAVTGLVEGSFGFNLEIVVLRTDRRLQHYWRDGAGWHEGPVIGQA